MISYEQLIEVLEYTEDTGFFTWKKSLANRISVGDIAGAIDGNGYRLIGIHGKRYRAHRLAWLYKTKHQPPEQIDHINGVRDDNRIINLRLASQKENMRNSSLRSDNTSGTIGIEWHKQNKRWRARITVSGKSIEIGSFLNKEDAIAARKEAEVKYGFHENHGKENRCRV